MNYQELQIEIEHYANISRKQEESDLIG